MVFYGVRSMEWIRVRRDLLCAMCGKSDWCSVSACGTLAHCMRIEGAKKAAKGGWIHKLTGHEVPVDIVKPKAVAKKSTKEWFEISEKMFNHKKASETRERLAEQLGVSVDSLNRLRVGWSADYAGEFASFPIRNVAGFVVGITRRYLHNGAKKTMQGSRGGLYYVDGWRLFKGPVLLPEGASDVAALVTLGLCCIGRWSNVGGADNLAEMLRSVNRPVFVIGERDKKPHESLSKQIQEQHDPNCEFCAACYPGRYGCETTATELAKLLKRRVRWIMPPDGAKDSRDWLVKHGADGGAYLNRLWKKEIKTLR